MARYLHFVYVLHGKKSLAKSVIKATEKGMLAFQQPTYTTISCCSNGLCMLMILMHF